MLCVFNYFKYMFVVFKILFNSPGLRSLIYWRFARDGVYSCRF